MLFTEMGEKWKRNRLGARGIEMKDSMTDMLDLKYWVDLCPTKR